MHLFPLCPLETVFPTVAAAEILSHVLHSLFQAWEIIPSKYTMYFLSKPCNNSLVPAVDQTLGHSDRNGPGHFWERWCASGSLWAVVWKPVSEQLWEITAWGAFNERGEIWKPVCEKRDGMTF